MDYNVKHWGNVGSKSSWQKPALQYNITDDDSRGSFYNPLIMKAININVSEHMWLK